jgi:hypothetical protein
MASAASLAPLLMSFRSHPFRSEAQLQGSLVSQYRPQSSRTVLCYHL